LNNPALNLTQLRGDNHLSQTWLIRLGQHQTTSFCQARALIDTNWNNTALVNTSGTIQECFTYNHFG
jgi:hypothetical protein